MPKPLAHTAALLATAAAGLLALRGAAPGTTSPIEPDEQALRIADDFRSWGALDQPVKVAPTLCRMPPGGGGTSGIGASEADTGPHAVKLYRLYARDPAAYRGVESGAPQGHQVLVKEAFEPVVYEMPGPGQIPSDVISAGGKLLRAGAPAGLFVMWHDASEVAGEERWTYATVSAEGDVTATGRIQSCVKCHSAAPHGGLFGMEE